MEFIYNDGGRSRYFKAKNVGDCAVRAIAIATGLDYKKVYDDLKALNGGQSCRNGTPKKIDKAYLTQLGWEWHSTMAIGQGCKVHLNENELPSGTLIVQVSKHLTCVIDGVIYDTFNPNDYSTGERCVYGYWTKPRKEENVNNITVDVLKRNIQGLRVKAGYTQETAAEELQVSRETMFRWENKPMLMPIVKLAKLAELYHCSVNDFFTE